MGAAVWRAGQSLDDQSRTGADRLDAKKKSLIACERQRWDRLRFVAERSAWDAADVVVIDEFGSNVDMTRSHARAPKGERAIAATPRNTPVNTTTIAALTTHGMGAALVVRGSVDRVTVETYLEQVLGPTLRPGQVVVLDNLRAHHGGRIRAIVQSFGCHVVYLPSYSPDYSPIELAISSIKTQLRRMAARTHDALDAAIATAFAHVTPAHARAYFAHCGFRCWPEDQLFCT